MTKEEIKHTVNSYFRKLKKQYKSIDPGFNVEAIHHFRVAYKKLRAFFRLVSAETEDGMKVPNKLKKVYRTLGDIRDMQLQQVRIMETAKQLPKQPQGYISLLGKEIAKAKKKFLEISSKDIPDETKKKALEEVPSNLNRNNFNDFYKKKRTDIRAIIASGNFSDDNLHSIRKGLKDIYYLQEIRQQSGPKGSSQAAGKGKIDKPLKEFLDKMGDFQDKRTGIALLKKSWLIQLNKSNQEILDKIKQGWLKDKMNMKRSLIGKLKSPNLQIA